MLIRLLSVLFFMLVGDVLAKQKTLTLYTESFPPYNFEKEDQITGINTEIVRLLCENANLHCTIDLYPWKRAMQLVSTRANSGIFSTSRTVQRESKFYWVGPLASGQTCFYKLATRSDITVNSMASLRNYTVGVARGDVYHSVLMDLNLEEGQHFLTYSKKFEELKMFKRGEHDLLIGSALTLASQLEKVGLSPEQLAPVFALNHPALAGNYLALNKSTSIETVKELQSHLKQLKATEQVDDIVSQFIPSAQQSHPYASAMLKECFTGNAIY